MESLQAELEEASGHENKTPLGLKPTLHRPVLQFMFKVRSTPWVLEFSHAYFLRKALA